MLNTFCWIHSTYTIPSAFWKRIGVDVAHPGIDKTVDPDERRYVRYYQWVCFCLFFQVQSACILSMAVYSYKSRIGEVSRGFDFFASPVVRKDSFPKLGPRKEKDFLEDSRI